MDIEEFRRKKRPKKTSNLKKFEVEIKELLNDGYSQLSICEFLKSNGINVTQPNLCRFIKKNSKSTTKLPQKKEENHQKESVVNDKVELKQSGLLKQSVVKNYEIVEPDYSKFK